MRKKSIRKNKTNRKKTYRKEKYHKKTNRRKSNLKKTKHKKTYLKKRKIQRGGSSSDRGDGGGEFSALFDNWDDPEAHEALIEEMEEKEEQLQVAAKVGQTLLEKAEELQEENERLEREAEEAEYRALELQEENERLEYRALELQDDLDRLVEAREEEMDTAVSNARAEGEKSGYEAEKIRNEEILKEILDSVNQLGLVTEGDSYSSVTNTEYIESTLKNMAGVIEGKIKQQIELGTAEVKKSLMEAEMGQALLDERIEELQKEVEEARETRDNAKREKGSALASLEKEKLKNSKLITRNQEVVSGHVKDKKVLRDQNKTYEAENILYRESNTELRKQNEKLTIESAKKEDCIEKTKRALGDDDHE